MRLEPSREHRSGRIIRESDPLNVESPLGGSDAFLTPTADFYIRNHFGEPQLDPAAWRLAVSGSVSAPFRISLAELRRMPGVTKVATLECAGNGRVFLVPRAKGLLWGDGAVGTAEWVGVPLRVLLDRAQIEANAIEVILEGADSGQTREEPLTPGPIAYARSIPLAKVDDVLLAYAMNGAPLEASHGSPLRAVVAGWYGMASVKWLQRIIVTTKPFAGYFQTLEYATFERHEGGPTLVGLTVNAVKAQITEPPRGATLPGGPVVVRGMAWAGEALVTRVEFSSDDGQTWADAAMEGEPIRHAWRRWSIPWRAPIETRECRLMARAHDDQGRVQPLIRNLDDRTYRINHVIPVEVKIRPT